MWLDGWQVGSRLPPTAKAEVAALLPRCRAALERPNPKALMGAIATVIAWMKDLGMLPAGDAQASARFAGYYRAVLEPMPADLMELAVQRVMAGHAFHSPPKPAAFTAAIQAEWNRRTFAVSRLETVQRFGKFDFEPLRAEDRADPGRVRALARDLADLARSQEAEALEDGE